MKTLETFDFGSAGVSRASYDWDTILDGNVHVMVKGEDFDCKPITLKSRARAVAQNMGVKVRTASDEDGNVVIQSYEAGAETEFDKKRQAAAKKLRDARLAKKAAKGEETEEEGEGEETEEAAPAPAKPAAKPVAAAPAAPAAPARRRK